MTTQKSMELNTLLAIKEPPKAMPFIMTLNCSQQRQRNKRMLPQSQMGLSSSYQHEIDESAKMSDIPPTPECIKVLRLPQSEDSETNQVTCLSYGPYDNGFLCLGTKSGHLLVLDPTSLDRISCQQMFT